MLPLAGLLPPGWISCPLALARGGEQPTQFGAQGGIPQEGRNSSDLHPSAWQRMCNIPQVSERRGEPEALLYFYLWLYIFLYILSYLFSFFAVPAAPKSTKAHIGLCCSSETSACAHPTSSFPSLTQFCFLVLFKTDKLIRK